MSDPLRGGSWPRVTRGEVTPGRYVPTGPPVRPESSLGGALRRLGLLLPILVGALVVRRFWPWFPDLGIVIGLTYVVARRVR